MEELKKVQIMAIPICLMIVIGAIGFVIGEGPARMIGVVIMMFGFFLFGWFGRIEHDLINKKKVNEND